MVEEAAAEEGAEEGEAAEPEPAEPVILLFSQLSSLELSDTEVYEP